MEGKKSSRLCGRQLTSFYRIPSHNEVLPSSGLLLDRLLRSPQPTRSVSSFCLSTTRILIFRIVRGKASTICDHMCVSPDEKWLAVKNTAFCLDSSLHFQGLKRNVTFNGSKHLFIWSVCVVKMRGIERVSQLYFVIF